MIAERRDACVMALRRAQISVDPPQATMYVWVPVPGGWSSAAFGRALLEREGVVVVPGSAFGAAGEGYFRVALTVRPERLREAGVRTGRVLEDLGGVGARP
jgi:LL-diaminopimelate aminotransferase